MDIQAVVFERNRLFDGGVPLGEVFVFQQALVGNTACILDRVVLNEADYLLCDSALVVFVAGGFDSGDASSALRLLFGVAEGAQHRAEVGVANKLTRLGSAAVAEVYLAGGGVKLGVLDFVRCETLMKAVIDREAVLGEVDRGLYDFGETHGAPACQSGRPCADNGGYAGGQVAVAGNEVDAVLTAPLDGERLRGPAHAGDGVSPAFFRGVHKRGNFAADATGLRLEQSLANAHSRRRVNGIAAAHQHLQAD